MFDDEGSVVGLWPGERLEDLAAEDRLCYELSCRLLADGWTGEGQHFLPAGVEGMVPGPFLAAIVSGVDPGRLNGHDAVRLMQARARLSAHDQAGIYEAMTQVAFSPPGDASSPVQRSHSEVEYSADEIAAALTLTRRSSDAELDRALILSGSLARVLHVFAAGNIDLTRVRVFCQGLGHLPEETVGVILDRILGEASGLTSGQLRARLSRLILEADPDGAVSAMKKGVEDRRVVAYPNPDLTGTLAVFNAAPDRVAAARAHIESLARGLRTGTESRTLDQIRADVALDLLSGKCVSHPRASSSNGGVHVTVTAQTLTRLCDQPGQLDGYAPVVAEIARKTVMEQIAGEWRFTVTDQGRPVATGTLSRRPTASQQRQVNTQYPTCVFPGCRQPAHQCDLDHRKPRSQGGPTQNDNLGPLCRHHHMLRHHKPWQLKRAPNGNHHWTSPLNHTYTRKRAPPD